MTLENIGQRQFGTLVIVLEINGKKVVATQHVVSPTMLSWKEACELKTMLDAEIRDGDAQTIRVRGVLYRAHTLPDYLTYPYTIKSVTDVEIENYSWHKKVFGYQ